jgi:peptidoglycan/xylan/chitin deacetylase (PgdA/CDA1 family)
VKSSLGALCALSLGLLAPIAITSPAAVAAPAPCSAGQVALTFDSGPNPAVTPALLDVLKEEGAKATFFVKGGAVAAYPELARRISTEGHVVGNHTWSHADLTTLDEPTMRQELATTEDALVAAGVGSSGLVRPPNGHLNEQVTDVLTDMHLTPVLWSVWSYDWANITADEIVDNVLTGLHPYWTNNVMMHDGSTPSSTTLEVVPRIIDGARALGYCFSTLGRDGQPTYEVPAIHAWATSARERGRVPARVTITLDRPAARTVPVILSTFSGSAVANRDFVPVYKAVWVPAGVRRMTVDIPVVDDRKWEPTETLTIRLRGDQRSNVRTTQLRTWVVSDDKRPKKRHHHRAH